KLSSKDASTVPSIPANAHASAAPSQMRVSAMSHSSKESRWIHRLWQNAGSWGSKKATLQRTIQLPSSYSSGSTNSQPSPHLLRRLDRINYGASEHRWVALSNED